MWPRAAWYAIDFDAQDYRVTTQVTRTDGVKGNVQGHVDMFGPIGESGRGNGICGVNVIDSQGSCARKLVFSDRTSVLFRIRPDNDVGYKVVFNVEPLPNEWGADLPGSRQHITSNAPTEVSALLPPTEFNRWRAGEGADREELEISSSA